MKKYTTLISILNQWLMFLNDDLFDEIDHMYTTLEKETKEELKSGALIDADIHFSNMVKQTVENIWDDLGQIFDRTNMMIGKGEWDSLEGYISRHIEHLGDKYLKKRESFMKSYNMPAQPYYLKSGLCFEHVDNYRQRLKKRNLYRRKLAESLYDIGNQSIDKSNYVITLVALLISLISLLISITAIL